MTQALSPVRQPPLPHQRWSRWHALGMLLALGACYHFRAAWPSAVIAAPSCLFFVGASRRNLTPSGRFGLANWATSLRFALVLSLTAPLGWVSTGSSVAITVGILVLDGLDGWLARKYGDASVFGAHFDMETDALLVLIVGLRLWLMEDYGAWVLGAGLLRYLYVLCVWLFPSAGREAPRSRFGRYAFSIVMAGQLGALLAPGVYGSLCVALGTLAVSVSFARSFYYSYAGS